MTRAEKMKSKPNIIIVHDDKRVLKQLKKLLTGKTEYNVDTFVSAQKAITYIKSNDIELVISNHDMPNMDGITFLSKLGKLTSQIPRIILAESSEKEKAMEAVNDIGVFQYIEKPRNEDDLLIVLRNGLENQYLKKTLGEKISEIKKTISVLDGLQKEIMKAFV